MGGKPHPETIGPFQIESELGRGMMGVVYKAKDTRSRRPVALKLIRMAFVVSEEQKAGFERRFVEEAQIVARLDHPGIVGVYEIGRDPVENAPYIAFEYLEGTTLDRVIEGGLPPWRDALRIVARVAEALEHAHRQGVIHRDVKPANVMILKEGGDPKIMDFGLAKRDAGLELTSTGQFLGTPLYMSPEQAQGRKVDARTDLFSLGSVAYTLLTGKRAFEGDSIPHVMNRVTYQNPPPPSQLRAELSPDVDYVVARAIAKSPADRFPTAMAMAEDIHDVWHGRTPRHRGAWTVPEDTGGGTVVAQRPAGGARKKRSGARRPGDSGSGSGSGSGLKKKRVRAAPADDISLVELTPIPEPKVSPAAEFLRRQEKKTGRSAFYVVLATLALGAGFYWRAEIARGFAPALQDPTPSPAPRVAPVAALERESTHAPEETTRPVEATLAPPAPTEATSAPTAEPTAEPTATPSPSAVPRRAATKKPVPTAKAKKAPAAAAAETAKILFTFEHHLKNGSMRVWVDDDSVLDKPLTSRVTQDLKVVKLRTGRLKDTFTVSPGKHRIRVELRTGGDIRAKETVANFAAGDAKKLEANLPLVRGSLSLEWK